MVKSMTGYGKVAVEVDDTQIDVEIKAVNHRFLDVAIKSPRTLMFLDDHLKKVVKKELSRGRVDVIVTLEGQALFEKKIDVDWSRVDQYIDRLQEIKNRYNLTGDISIDMVSKLEDIFTEKEAQEDSDALQTVLVQAAKDAVQRLLHMRIQEGNELHQDLSLRVDNVREFIRSLDDRRPIVIEAYKERIRNRVEEYTREQIRPDDTKILQEVALLAEKGDVTEELTRLESHLIQFEETLEREEPIGRRLDFIVQEMHREVNTIGSKSNDGQVMETVVNLKSEIEKMKEQVQNVE